MFSISGKKGRVNGKISSIRDKTFFVQEYNYYDDPVPDEHSKNEKKSKRTKKHRKSTSQRQTPRPKQQKTGKTKKPCESSILFPELEDIRQNLVDRLLQKGYKDIENKFITMLMMLIEESEDLPDDTFTINFQNRTWTSKEIGKYIADRR
jgi:hypothetical protein